MEKTVDIKTLENKDFDSLERQHKIIEIANEMNELQSCCGSSCDIRALLYLKKVAILFIVLIFVIFKLVFDENNENTNIYINVLMVILGVAINNQSDKKK